MKTKTEQEDVSSIGVLSDVGGCKISRVWAMPNKWTFTIPPIADLIKKYVGDGKGWIDPFAGMTSPAEITNDLNPDRPTTHHMHAKDFVTQLKGKHMGCLFDPPYSLRQTKECYEGIGITMEQEDTQSFPNNIKRLIAPKIETGGIVICFGWNSMGFGKGLGFDFREILLVSHGGHHNDTIITVEQKIRYELEL